MMRRRYWLQSAKTGRCVIVHEAARTGGFGAEIAALIAERGCLSLLAPVVRVTGYDTVIPLPRLEQYYMPSVGRIVAAARERLSIRLNHGMTAMRQFTLPDLGEGLEEAEIVAWHVNEGDHVVADQPLVSVETDKAVVEVPSPWSGRIGAPVRRQGRHRQGRGAAGRICRGRRGGHRHGRRRDRPRRDQRKARGRGIAAGRADARTRGLRSCRRYARSRASSTSISTWCRRRGPGGAITRADVERAAKSLVEAGPAEPLRGMRRAMAQRMAAANAEVVRTTVTDEADIDDWGKGEDITIRLVRAIAAACKAEPSLNAWYNSAAGRAAADQARSISALRSIPKAGLIVPVLRNVGERDARDLRAGLDRMRADAAARSIPPDELRGATITLSNFGMIGGRFANLIVVPPQVAIIGAGRVGEAGAAHDGQPAVRRALPLSLTFDHRVVTGGEAARFLVALKSDLERSSASGTAGVARGGELDPADRARLFSLLLVGRGAERPLSHLRSQRGFARRLRRMPNKSRKKHDRHAQPHDRARP